MINYKKLLSKIAIPLMSICYNFSGLVNRDSNIWLFGAWRGQQYSDNSKYMFEYMLKNHTDTEIYWVTKNDDIYNELIELGYPVLKSKSILTLIYILRAGVVFETEGVQDIPFHWFLKGIKTIQLFHGFPLKSGVKWVENRKFNRSRYPWQNQYDSMYWMSTSPKYSEIYHKWGLLGVTIPTKQFSITGYARNDTFINKPKNSFLERFRYQHPSSKLICYMPTHRNFGESSNTVLSEETLIDVNNKLQELDVFMILKPHFHEIKHFLGQESIYDHIIFAHTKEFSDVYEYIHGVDLLISDYSSIIVDYLCANKPIVIFDYDLEDYMEYDAGLEKIYFELDFGPRCKSWPEVLKAVESLLKNDSWILRRREALYVTQSFNDGLNCERIYKAVKEITS